MGIAAGMAASALGLAGSNPLDRLDGKKDPVPAFAYSLEINSVQKATFTTCSGLSVKREFEAVKQGGFNDGVVYLPGRITYGQITLESGISTSEELWEWFLTGAIDGKVDYRKVTIKQFIPYTQDYVRKYELEDCFPVSWTGPSLDTSSTSVAIEKLELVFTRFTVDD